MKLRETGVACQDVTMSNEVTSLLGFHVDEQVGLTLDLLQMLSEDDMAWRPQQLYPPESRVFSLLQLTGHLAESITALCACFYKLHSGEMSYLESFRKQIAEQPAKDLAGFIEQISRARQYISEGFLLTKDEDLPRMVPTYFVPDGEPFLNILMTNWKHVVNHNYQLFLFMRIKGFQISTQHLFRFK